MTEPEVSIILPTYNRAPVLGRAIRSILAQTYSKFELLVIDNGSTDDTRKIVSQFDDRRVVYIREEGRVGAAIARNIGIERSRAPLIAFQDSDDEWLIDKLSKQVNFLAFLGSSVDMIASGYLIARRDAKFQYYGAADHMVAGNWTAEQIYDFGFITPTWLVRRTVFDSVGEFDALLPNLEDWELVFRIFRRHRIAVIDEPLLIKYGSEDSINFHRSSRIDSLQIILRKHEELWQSSPRVLARLYGELGTLQCATGEARAGRKHLWQAIRRNVYDLKTWLKFFAACGGAWVYRRASGFVG